MWGVGLVSALLLVGCPDEGGETMSGVSSSVSGPGSTTTSTSVGGMGNSVSSGAGAMGGGDQAEGGGGTAPSAQPWSRGAGTVQDDYAYSIATNSLGGVVTVGSYDGAMDWGSGSLTDAAAGYDDIFVVKHDADGTLRWSHGFGGPRSAYVRGVVIDGAGDVLIAGMFHYEIDFGSGPRTGFYQVFLTKLSGSTGAELWTRQWGDINATNIALDLAVDAQGAIVVGGYYSSLIDFGGGPLVTYGTGDADAFLVKVDGAGQHVWSQHFGGVGYDRIDAVAIDAQGNVYAAGRFEQSATFGGTTFVADGGQFDGFLAKYDGAGQHQWSKAFHGPFADSNCDEVSVDGGGNVFVACTGRDDYDFGGGPLVGPGGTGSDAFIAKFDAAGAHAWSHRYASVFSNSIRGLRADANGHVRFALNFRETIDLGFGPWFSAEGDFVLVELDATGQVIWHNALLLPGYQGAADVAWDPAGDPIAAGSYEGGTTFDAGGALTSFGGRDAFVAKIPR